MAVRPYGRVVLMGGVGMLGGAGLDLPYPWIMRNCITIHGKWMCPPHAVNLMVGLIRSGLVKLDHFEVTTAFDSNGRCRTTPLPMPPPIAARSRCGFEPIGLQYPKLPRCHGCAIPRSMSETTPIHCLKQGQQEAARFDRTASAPAEQRMRRPGRHGLDAVFLRGARDHFGVRRCASPPDGDDLGRQRLGALGDPQDAGRRHG